MDKLDFELSYDGDVVFANNNISMIKNREIQVQCFRQLLRTRLGEYFLNINEGLDYDVLLGVKEIDDEELMTALQNVGEQVQDFVRYESIEYDFDRQLRKFTIKFAAIFSDNLEILIEEEVFL